MEKQTFVGKVKVIKTQYGDLIKLSFGPEDLKKAENGWLNVVYKKNKDGLPYMVLDTWKPDPNNKNVQNPVQNPEDGMPF